ncbi:hypothetical protein ACKI1I_33790 [Streptomyces turgidiscabies]|uniref:Uncharacterized protein n=1 Tax=Streptomyces turgidiscabies (strain Car8) TaxID=698760 RepID=L7EV48_STRT8|nr:MULTISPECIES: hypothetical protein [Streptomyces]ELP62260.1 hypothetical protein STRTUCAR8_04738 [Streptomyces turgidiscabies Car8]MDX3498723.1 hypothetical protein [Streptomyces turgidiscabies]GAQ74849.1 hypothetical protein T45_06629 [Streptomyces turgidiscabies]
MTPYSLAFYMDVVTTGTVLGVSPADSPERVVEVLGPGFTEDIRNDHNLCLGGGLVEFFWNRASVDDPWSGYHLTLQVRRLAYRNRTHVPDVLRTRYGRFTPRLRFEKLRRLLARRGVTLVEIPEIVSSGPYFRTFWQPESLVAVTVIGTYGEYETPENLRVGDVYSIHGPITAKDVERRRARPGGAWPDGVVA